ncbi:MAG: ABC transporter substrate-binding protein [Alkalilacustris sp.]
MYLAKEAFHETSARTCGAAGRCAALAVPGPTSRLATDHAAGLSLRAGHGRAGSAGGLQWLVHQPHRRDRDADGPRSQHEPLFPRLAETIEARNDTTWHVTLRDGLRFHDGSPVDADAVVASVTAVGKPRSPGPQPRLARPRSSCLPMPRLASPRLAAPLLRPGLRARPLRSPHTRRHPHWQTHPLPAPQRPTEQPQ